MFVECLSCSNITVNCYYIQVLQSIIYMDYVQPCSCKKLTMHAEKKKYIQQN